MLLCMTACQKEENGILTLEVEHYTSSAKVHIDDNYAVWDDDDQVKVNGNDYTVNVSSNSATITGVPEANSYYAIYPANWATGNTTLNIPGMQTYRENGNGDQIVDAPMFAYSDGNTLKFRNLGALLAVNVNNQTGSDFTVVSIDVTAQGASLCGSATISNYLSEEPAMSVSGHNAVTLYCNTTIAANGSKVFYISLPPITASELTITVNNATHAYTKTRTSSITLGRNAGQCVEFSTATATVASHSGPLPNQIWYTCTSNPNAYLVKEGYGANFVSCTRTSTLGVITFDGPISTIPNDSFHWSPGRGGKLTSITLPANVTTVGEKVFLENLHLESVIMPGVTSVGEEAMSVCTKLTTVTLPCLLNIGTKAFYYSGVTNITLPNLISVSNSAFSNCESLTSVSLPKATSLEENAFEYCTALESVSIPNVTNLEGGAFNGCSSLTTVYADNVANIGQDAFTGCTSLAHLYSNTAAPTITGSTVFFLVPSTAVLHLPASCQGTANWNNWPGTISYDYGL